MNDKKKVEYFWWEGKDLAPFFATVQELGAENVRIQFNPHTKLLKIVPIGEGLRNGVTTYNFSHPCTPDCGD